MRKILTPLLVIPFGMLISISLRPDWQAENSGFEYLFLLIGIPILILNFFAWFQPEIITAYFPVKKEWMQKSNDKSLLPIVASTFIVIVLVGVGTASIARKVDADRDLEPSLVRMATNNAVPTFVPLPSRTAVPSQAVVSSNTQSPTVGSIQNAQIPISGGTSMTATGVPADSVVSTEAAQAASNCVAADAQYLEPVWEAVELSNPDNEIETGWVIKSSEAANLWFVAATIQGPEIDAGTELPGVWAVFLYPDGNFDLYAINETAIELSFGAWGTDNDPVLTMQTDGAQTAYTCALDSN